jgi:hypothetical protein
VKRLWELSKQIGVSENFEDMMLSRGSIMFHHWPRVCVFTRIKDEFPERVISPRSWSQVLAQIKIESFKR